MTVRSATATFAIATIAAILTAGPAAAQAPGSSPGAAPVPSPADAVKGFSIVLVEGSLQPGTSSELPAAARAAIEDIKDFLPYKSFQLLDASWMIGTADVKSRLRAGDREYDVVVTAAPQQDAKSLTIKFLLRDAGRQESQTSSTAPAVTAGTYDFLRAQLVAAYSQVESLRAKYAEGHPELVAKEQVAARLRDKLLMFERQQEGNLRRLGEQGRAAGAPLIDTSFSMRIGETVVVGTSRVNGERALIALMTAVSKEPVVVRRQF